MTDKNTYATLKHFRRMQLVAICRVPVSILLFTLLFPALSFSNEDPKSELDEISIFLNVQGIGGLELPAVIRGQEIFLSVTDLFNFLKIRINPSSGLDSVSGFFITPEATLLIDKANNRILYNGKVFNLKPDDLIRTETNLYLKSDYFGEVFGLDCTFNFRSLSVTLNTNIELPIIREMRQELMRNNISRLKGVVKTDTIIPRSYPVFKMGMADWSVIATQQAQGTSNTRLNLSIGSVIAGGEAFFSLNYNSNTPFSSRNQFYLWRFANNDYQALRQVMAGKIASQATSSIFAPVVGLQFTNTPTTYRRSFGTYRLSDATEPGWIVELYVNNVLVDYTKADASGFFTFEVPLLYGNSVVNLRFYGPWGEERTREQSVNIPFNFLPKNEFEYTLCAGMVEDGLGSRFSRGNFNYGLGTLMTVGGGIEYFSSVTSGNIMPFLNTSLRLASNLLLSGEYTYGVRSKAILSYRLPSNLELELNYTNYDKGQTAIGFNYLEERKATLTMPFRGRNFAVFSRITINQIVMPATKYTTAQLLLSGVVLGVSTNFTTYGLFAGQARPYTYSILSQTYRLPAGFVFTPQIQYEYNKNKVTTMRVELEKQLFVRGFLNLSFENNFNSRSYNMGIGLRYDFSFAQTAFYARKGNNNTATTVQSARGSFIYDKKTSYLGTSNRTSVGKGGIVILPFLDLNANGLHEKGEPKVAGLTFRINGGRVQYNERDTVIRIFDLEPYTNYTVELDRNSFDNIAWQLKKATLSVAIDPNQLKLIEVPVSIAGEASGMVYFNSDKGQHGLERIIVNFYRNDSILVGHTLTESDGYFSFLGLAPGSYTARIDTAQLHKLNMAASPAVLPFNISGTTDGDVVDGLQFVLEPLRIDTSDIILPQAAEQTDPTPEPQIVPQKETPVAQGSFAIQVGAFGVEANALATQKRLSIAFGRSVLIVSEGGLYKVRVAGFAGRKEASLFKPKVAEQGFRESYIVKVK